MAHEFLRVTLTIPSWRTLWGFFFSLSVAVVSINAQSADKINYQLTELPFVTFEIPDSWECIKIDFQWACRPKNQVERSALAVIVGKVAGAQDNFDALLRELSAPRTLHKGGSSQVFHARRKLIGGQDWIESLHLGSELANFYTFYLATVKDSLGVLISLSTPKDRAKDFNPIFKRLIDSLKLTESAEDWVLSSEATPVPSSQEYHLDTNKLELFGVELPVEKSLALWTAVGLLGIVVIFLALANLKS